MNVIAIANVGIMATLAFLASFYGLQCELLKRGVRLDGRLSLFRVWRATKLVREPSVMLTWWKALTAIFAVAMFMAIPATIYAWTR